MWRSCSVGGPKAVRVRLASSGGAMHYALRERIRLVNQAAESEGIPRKCLRQSLARYRSDYKSMTRRADGEPRAGVPERTT